VLRDDSNENNFRAGIAVENSPIWEKGETLPFVYNGTNFVLTSLSHSSITQTANEIKAEVVSKEGGDTTGFSWSL